MIRGFTLVELAIVIVIAGILAAVAIPIYQGIVVKAKWSEGKTSVDTIADSLRVLRAESGGHLNAYSGADGPGPLVWADLDLDQNEFNGENFNSADYTFAALVKAAGTYTLQVGPSSVPGGPSETYTVDERGVTGGTAP